VSFLNLWALWIAAGVIPTLLILYFLKLRRREQVVPSTLLWKQAVQDLQVNAPFQRLRKNLLLLLQLLILSAAIVALARPIVESDAVDAARMVIMIDRSASMNTVEPDGETRLEHAKEQAVRRVQTVNKRTKRWFSFAGAEPRTQVMVIAFSSRATVISPFTTNVSDLVSLVRDIAPTDEPTHMSEAIALAEAYMATTVVEMNPVSPEEGARLVLFSDGRIADRDRLAIKSGTLEHVVIGERADNVGVTALRVQRNYERPAELNVFAQIRNFGPEPVSTDVTLRLDGQIIGVQHLDIEAGAEPRESTSQPSNPPMAEDRGVAALSFSETLDRGGLLEISLSHEDALNTDNRAYNVVPPPRQLSVLMVSSKGTFLSSVLDGLPLAQWVFWSPSKYESAPDSELEKDGVSLFDVVIFDQHSTSRLPRGNYLFFGCIPEVEGVSVSGEVEGQPIMWWDETHPILHNLVLDYVYVAKWLDMKVPDAAERLIEGPDGPILARWIDGGRHFVVLAFAVEFSTWWDKPSFPVFVYNTVQYLGRAVTGEGQTAVHPGETLQVGVPAGKDSVTLRCPDSRSVELLKGPSGLARFGGTDRVGVYRAEDGIESQDVFAVNMEDEHESDIAPRAMTSVGGVTEVVTGRSIDTSTPEVWRWFVGAALLIALFEWYVYNRRVLV
jgi:hypothetical protein